MSFVEPVVSFIIAAAKHVTRQRMLPQNARKAAMLNDKCYPKRFLVNTLMKVSSMSNQRRLLLVFPEDVFVLKDKDGKDPEIFGLFSTTR